MPMYLLAFDQSQSVEQNIIHRVLDEMAQLSREPEFLLRGELRDLIPYHAVLMALAQAKTAPAQLAQAQGVDAGGIHYHLQTLMDLGYVQRSQPLTGGKANVRAVRYALDDPFPRFWFRFVFPHQSVLRMLGPRQGYAEVIKPNIESYYGTCFERLCREALPFIYRAEGVRSAFECGEYWDKETQIDVVGMREDGWTDLGECKWGDVASMTALSAELESKVARFPNPRNATIGRRFFARGLRAGAKPPANATVHTLKELYTLKSGG